EHRTARLRDRIFDLCAFQILIMMNVAVLQRGARTLIAQLLPNRSPRLGPLRPHLPRHSVLPPSRSSSRLSYRLIITPDHTGNAPIRSTRMEPVEDLPRSIRQHVQAHRAAHCTAALQQTTPRIAVKPHVQRNRGPVTAVVLQFSAARCRGSAVLSAVVPPALTCGFTPRHGITALLHPLTKKLTVVQERPSFFARIVLILEKTMQ